MKDISVEDIFNCIIYELHELRHLYEYSHLVELKSKLLKFASEMDGAIADGNSQKIMAIMDHVIELYVWIPDVGVSLPLLENANYDHSLNRHIMNGTVVVLGDSHTCFFSGNENLSFFCR